MLVPGSVISVIHSVIHFICFHPADLRFRVERLLGRMGSWFRGARLATEAFEGPYGKALAAYVVTPPAIDWSSSKDPASNDEILNVNSWGAVYDEMYKDRCIRYTRGHFLPSCDKLRFFNMFAYSPAGVQRLEQKLLIISVRVVELLPLYWIMCD